MKKILSKLAEIFQDSSKLMSSKRVFGGIGFIVGLTMPFYNISNEIILTVLGISAVMLGADSLLDIWKK